MNERLRGHRVYKGQIIARDVWPAILTDQEWFDLQRVIRSNQRMTTNAAGNKPTTLATLIASCSECEAPVRASSYHVTTKTYKCSSCPRHWTRDDVDQLITEAVFAELAQPETKADVLAGMKTPKPKRSEAEIRETLDNLARDYRDGYLSREALDESREMLMFELQQIEEPAPILVSENLRGFTRAQLEKFWSTQTLESKRRIVKELFDSIQLPVSKNGMQPLITNIAVTTV